MAPRARDSGGNDDRPGPARHPKSAIRESVDRLKALEDLRNDLAEFRTDLENLEALIRADERTVHGRRIANAIQAAWATRTHTTRDYTPVDAAYDNAVEIARTTGRARQGDGQP